MDIDKKIKVVFHSNYSRMKTGFGKNMRNILLELHNDPEIEVVEACNGLIFGSDAKTPWRSYGTAPNDPEIINFIGGDPHKGRVASYGFYGIDAIIEKEKPDVYIGIEDIWAFNGFIDYKKWWPKTKKIIWTTLDSLPIIGESFKMEKNCEKFLVWASFAEEEMKKLGCNNVETLHGAVSLENFFEIKNKKELKKKYGLDSNFVIGFVCKNQLRKSIPNLLEGFRLFQESRPDLKAKLLIHTDWADKAHGWDIPSLISEKNINPEDVLSCYSCSSCSDFTIEPFKEDEKDCPHCLSKKGLKPKNSLSGLTESQLNVIYNLMDVYCHPFTSGGQEIPIQEAKAAGLITLVTEYSCGTDSCYPHQGGLPLKWNEYREPHSQFIKASTCPKDICKQLINVAEMEEEEKRNLIENGKKYVEENFSTKKIVERLKLKIKEVINNDFRSENKNEENDASKNDNMVRLDSFLDKEKKDRILIVVPENEEDLFLFSSILPQIKSLYPEKDIYFSTKKEYFSVLRGNPLIYKLIEYKEQMENPLLMEGYENFNGYFEICFTPHLEAQRYKNYIHNSKDIIDQNLKCIY